MRTRFPALLLLSLALVNPSLRAQPADPSGQSKPTKPAATHPEAAGRAVATPATPDFAHLTPLAVVRVSQSGVVVKNGSAEETLAMIGVEPPAPIAASGTPSATPDSERLGAWLSNLLAGESVFVLDHEESRHNDGAGHRLVYLYRAPDGLFINLETVRQGYAREQSDFPYKAQDAFRASESRAKAAHKGLWAAPTKPGTPAKDSKEPKDPAAPGGPPAAPSTDKPAQDKPAATKPADPSANADEKVFATRSGSKYHRETCRHLTTTKEQLTVSQAKARGLKPCTECKPPE